MIEQKLHFTLSLLCVCVVGGGVLITSKSSGHDFPTHKKDFFILLWFQ